MSKIFPVRNEIISGNDMQPEQINDNTRPCFETANGGIDEYNIVIGSSISGSGGLESEKFASGAFFQYKTRGGNESSPSTFTIDADNESVALIKAFSNTETGLDAGMITGQLQVRYKMSILGFDSAADLDYKAEYYEITPTHRYAIYMNGAKVGETETFAEMPYGGVMVPFFFYHAGGDIDVDIYVSVDGTGVLNSETSRYEIENYYYFLINRKR